MNEELKEKIVKKIRSIFSRSGFFVIALLLNLILFSLLASYIVFNGLPALTTQTAFQKINVPPPKPPVTPPAQKGGSVQNLMDPNVKVTPPPVKLSIVTTTNPSNFLIDATSTKTPKLLNTVDPQSGAGLPGKGTPGPGSGGSGDNPFGDPNGGSGNTLTGYMYDLKQTVDRQPTGMTPQKYQEILANLVTHNWDESILAPYYKSPNPLYTTHILIPDMQADAGPKAFHLENEVQPNMWIVWYKGKITAPKHGTYFFAGFCDDILLVRVDGQNVLDGSNLPTIPNFNRETPWPNDWIPNRVPDQAYGFLRKSRPFTLTDFRAVDIDIIIGEEPGGAFNASLFILNPGETYPVDAGGEPILPLFEVGTTRTDFEGVHPPVSPQTVAW